MTGLTDEQLQSKLAEDPGSPVFADYADRLRKRGEHLQALAVALAGLSANSACHHGRIILARILYEMGFLPFAAREIHIVREALPELKSVRKLAERFDPEIQAADSAATDGTLAEEEFDIAEIDVIGDESDPKKP